MDEPLDVLDITALYDLFRTWKLGAMLVGPDINRGTCVSNAIWMISLVVVALKFC